MVDGNFRPFSSSVTPTVDTNAYASGDCIAGIVTFPNVFGGGGGWAKVSLLDIIELGGTNKPSLTIQFFSENPSAGTYTDNAALSVNATDKALKTGPTLQVVAGDYVSNGGDQDASIQAPEFHVQGSGPHLYALVQCDAAVTFAAASNLKLRLAGHRAGE